MQGIPTVRSIEKIDNHKVILLSKPGTEDNSEYTAKKIDLLHKELKLSNLGFQEKIDEINENCDSKSVVLLNEVTEKDARIAEESIKSILNVDSINPATQFIIDIEEFNINEMPISIIDVLPETCEPSTSIEIGW